MYKHLTLEQSILKHSASSNFSIIRIAEAVGFHKSTVSRELKRNSIQSLHPPDCYKASAVHTFSCKRENILEDANIKLASVVSDVFGKTGSYIIDALCQGVTNPDALAELAKGSLIKKERSASKSTQW